MREGIYGTCDIIKERLKNNKYDVIEVLTKLGCHHINSYGDEIRCALPDGDNQSSVSILICDNMTSTIFSRSISGDIINLVKYILNCGFESAIRWLCGVLNVDFDGDFIEYKQNPTIKVIEDVKRRDKPKEEITHEVLNSNFLNAFTKDIVNEWEREFIPAWVQQKFGVCVDERNARYIIPIYNENGDLITCKGRVYLPDFEALGIPKYLYYQPLGKNRNDILFGLNFNKDKIKGKREVVLFESEKSVMKAYGYGYDFSVSIGTKTINPNLVRKILSLHCDVVIAFDKDVPKSEVMKEAKKLTMFTNVSIIIDYDNLLKGKDAPVDRGKDVWEVLYKNKQRVR